MAREFIDSPIKQVAFEVLSVTSGAAVAFTTLKHANATSVIVQSSQPVRWVLDNTDDVLSTTVGLRMIDGQTTTLVLTQAEFAKVRFIAEDTTSNVTCCYIAYAVRS